MNEKGINNLSIETRVNELNDYHLLHKNFGDQAFRAIEKYNFNAGYALGLERIIKLLKVEEFPADSFMENAVEIIQSFLSEYFKDRGGNQPDIRVKKKTVYLKTENCKYCLTIEAEKQAEKCHADVCAIYCRSFAKGIVKVLEEFYPGLVINFYNVSSRRDGRDSDCVEAFQVITPTGRQHL